MWSLIHIDEVCTFVVLSVLVCCPASHPKLKEKPTLKDLVAHVVPVIATPKWCNVGLELGVEQFKLETIGGFSREDFESYCYAMFSSWLNGEPGTGRGEKTWAAVIAAVETVKGKDAGYREAIKEIFGGTSVSQYRHRCTHVLCGGF